MKRFSLILFALLCVALLADVTSFVPKDYDFFVLLKGNSLYYNRLSNVPLFRFILKGDKIALENVFISLLENTCNSMGISMNTVYEALEGDILFASKGTEFTLDQFFSLDLNYYFQVLRNIGSNSIVVLKSSKPEQLLRLMARLMDLKLTKSDRVWTLHDTDVAIFAAVHEGYLVISGSRTALMKAVDAYDLAPMQLKSEEIAVRELLNQSAWLYGFFRKDSFRIKGPFVSSNNAETDYVTVIGIPVGESLKIEVRQQLSSSKGMERYVSSSTVMLGMPFIGNFAFSATAAGPMDLAESLSQWFQGAQDELKKIYDIVSYILKFSTGRVYMTGDLFGEQIRLAAVFELSKEIDPGFLIKYGARSFGNEMRLPILNGFISFFPSEKRFIMTNLTKDEYERLANRKRLRDDVAYQYIARNYSNQDILRLYIDVGSLLKLLLGVNATGKFFLTQQFDGQCLIYRMEVM
ncbi:hypothetical protein [Pseudothermotoga sp.]|nr:hypothetical protein [Pseudothermotoga sp.]MCX7812032.1 hypothetical protein [Pseudothermotoga sp.]MDW8139102.1 hypothetical protein [Pseudothermotoga sp.]